jgi:hypothetical protein
MGVTAPLALALALVSAPAHAVPTVVPYMGYLTFAAGGPYNGSVAVTVSLHASASAQEAVWGPVSLGEVAVNDGVLALTLGGSAAPLDAALLASELWLSISIGSTTLAPRQQILAVPYARLAQNSLQLGGVSASAFVQSTALAAVATSGSAAHLTDGASLARVQDLADVAFNGSVESLMGNAVDNPIFGGVFVQSGGDTLSGDLDFANNRLLQARLEVASAAPVACAAATAGRFYFDTTESSLMVCDGTEWVASGGGGSGGPGGACAAAPEVFVFTGSQQSYVVPSIPAGCTSLVVEAWGGGGGGSVNFQGGAGGDGGGGGYATATYTVQAGQAFTIQVGGGGAAGGSNASNANFPGLGGYGGGGAGAAQGAGGGGRTVVSGPNGIRVIAGGGGGGGFDSHAGAGGGQNGDSGAGGRGGNGSAGGAGGVGSGSGNLSNGGAGGSWVDAALNTPGNGGTGGGTGGTGGSTGTTPGSPNIGANGGGGGAGASFGGGGGGAGGSGSGASSAGTGTSPGAGSSVVFSGGGGGSAGGGGGAGWTGGGGGGGYGGGGGGGSAHSVGAKGGGGGGSSFAGTMVAGSATVTGTTIGGSYRNPGNAAGLGASGLARGGAGAPAGTPCSVAVPCYGDAGTPGRVILRWE